MLAKFGIAIEIAFYAFICYFYIILFHFIQILLLHPPHYLPKSAEQRYSIVTTDQSHITNGIEFAFYCTIRCQYYTPQLVSRDMLLLYLNPIF